MTFDNVIELIKIENVKNAYGELAQTEVRKQVYCSIKNIRNQEYIQAMALGYEPTYIFVLSEPLEYEGEEKVIFENIEYRIIKQYFDRTFNILELTCSKIVLED